MAGQDDQLPLYDDQASRKLYLESVLERTAGVIIEAAQQTTPDRQNWSDRRFAFLIWKFLVPFSAAQLTQGAIRAMPEAAQVVLTSTFSCGDLVKYLPRMHRGKRWRQLYQNRGSVVTRLAQYKLANNFNLLLNLKGVRQALGIINCGGVGEADDDRGHP
jgi:hypothetical protein